jgi:hypothetical protein
MPLKTKVVSAATDWTAVADASENHGELLVPHVDCSMWLSMARRLTLLVQWAKRRGVHGSVWQGGVGRDCGSAGGPRHYGCDVVVM